VSVASCAVRRPGIAVQSPAETLARHEWGRSIVLWGRATGRGCKKSWDRLPACHFPRISDRLEAYPTQ
jgi:hypothetical protein